MRRNYYPAPEVTRAEMVRFYKLKYSMVRFVNMWYYIKQYGRRMTIIKDFPHFRETETLLYGLGMKHSHTAKTNLKQMQHKIPRGAFGTLWKYDGPYGEGVVIFFKGVHGYVVSYYLFKTERRPPVWKR